MQLKIIKFFWVVLCCGVVAFSANDPKRTLSKNTQGQLESYYKLLKINSESFFKKPDKRFQLLIWDREFIQKEEKLLIRKSELQLGKSLESVFKDYMKKNKLSIPVKRIHSHKELLQALKLSDMTFLIATDLVFTRIDYLKDQNQVKTVDITIAFKTFIPAVHGQKSMGAFFMKDRIFNQPFSIKTLTTLISEKLMEHYIWKDFTQIIGYLKQNPKGILYITGKLFHQPDDLIAARLLSLSSWDKTMKILMENKQIENLIEAQLLYPFSPQLSQMIYRHALTLQSVKDKIKWLNYLYMSRFPGNYSRLINDILAEIKGPEMIDLSYPVIKIAGEKGDKLTLELLGNIDKHILPGKNNKKIMNYLKQLHISQKMLQTNLKKK